MKDKRITTGYLGYRKVIFDPVNYGVVPERRKIFCPDDCKYLSITEEQQDMFNRKDIPHVCRKIGKRVMHGVFHPKLVQLEECKKEILFRKFDR